MYKIAFDATRSSLYQPGNAENFFALGFDLTDEKTLCAEMARLAYVKEEDRLKTYLGRARFDLHCVLGYESGGTQVFIAKTKPNLDNPVLVITFRGTEGDDPSDLLADANLLKSPWVGASGNPLGKVHTGFADALLKDPGDGNILSLIYAQLNDLNSQFTNILLTGHSLGAALATLTASYLDQTPLAAKIHLYTFGSPLVGDRDFSEQMASVKHERYVNCCDLVTRIPPESLGYLHVGTLHYIDRHGGINKSISENAITEDRLKAAATYVADYSYLQGTVWVRELADHSPINYLSGVAGLRA